MISLTNARVRVHGTTALQDFTGTFPTGSVTALIGGDGAGKSTLLKVLAGRLDAVPDQPSLIRDRTEIGYQPADSGVWRNLSVEENIEFVARTYGLPRTRARARADELLGRAGLDHVRSRVAGRLSGGMRQKLGFVLASLHEPDLVLLDEPTTGVDPVSRGEIWSLMASAAAEGATVVFATTYLDEAERAARLFLLGAGRLLTSGTAEEVAARTPGRIWQTPVDNTSAGAAPVRAELRSPDVWRRGRSAYLWTPDADARAPEGFTPSEADLENTSIALLLAEESEDDLGATASGPDIPAARAAAPDHPAEAPSLRRPGHGVRGIGVARDSTTQTGHARRLVRAEDVARAYGGFAALSGVSLSVAPGEIVGLLGGNGAGKTTLMRIVLGLEAATSGACTLFGEQPSLEARRRLGYVAQGLGLYPSLSAVENLRFAASVHRTGIGEEAAEFARSCGSRPVSALPLGLQRTLAYRAATVHGPELLILDEPTSGMDALARARLWKELRAEADRGVGVLVTTHYMQEAAQCDRLVVLAAGEVTARGTVDDITAGRTSVTVRAEHWEDAFTLLRDAGTHVVLDGRVVRVPGASAAEVGATLTPLAGQVRIGEDRATLEETMLLASATGR